MENWDHLHQASHGKSSLRAKRARRASATLQVHLNDVSFEIRLRENERKLTKHRGMAPAGQRRAQQQQAEEQRDRRRPGR